MLTRSLKYCFLLQHHSKHSWNKSPVKTGNWEKHLETKITFNLQLFYCNIFRKWSISSRPSVSPHCIKVNLLSSMSIPFIEWSPRDDTIAISIFISVVPSGGSIVTQISRGFHGKQALSWLQQRRDLLHNPNCYTPRTFPILFIRGVAIK